MMGEDENLILQELVSVSFIAELHKNNFLESEFFQKMHFDNPNIKILIDKIKIDNQGMLLMFLYSLLLTPKEKIYMDYKTEYGLLDEEIDGFKTSKESTYPDDNPKTKYIKHIRNAVAHGKVEYTKNSIIFKDSNKDKRFLVELPLNKIGFLLNKLQIILYKYIYIDDLKTRL